jgi:hypothetical protein
MTDLSLKTAPPSINLINHLTCLSIHHAGVNQPYMHLVGVTGWEPYVVKQTRIWPGFFPYVVKKPALARILPKGGGPLHGKGADPP